jgi:acyl-CoA hydrolase
VPVYPEYINELGNVHAGHLMKLIDICGVLAPFRHLDRRGTLVTASLDRTNFINPIRRWEIITLESRLTQVWNTSLETEVKVYAWNFRLNETRPVATAYLAFVALDEKQRKVQVPALTLATPEDIQLAEAAELRKRNRMLEGQEVPIIPIDPMTEQPVVIEQVMTPNDSNTFNKVFGGVILDLIHQAGNKAARVQTLGGSVTAVRQDRMSFLQPAFIGEVVTARAIVTRTWITSIEVQVEVEATNPTSGLSRKIGHSYLVYVGLDPEGAPFQVPPWVPQTELQKQRAETAVIRRKNREAEAKLVMQAQSGQDAMV